MRGCLPVTIGEAGLTQCPSFGSASFVIAARASSWHISCDAYPHSVQSGTTRLQTGGCHEAEPPSHFSRGSGCPFTGQDMCDVGHLTTWPHQLCLSQPSPVRWVPETAHTHGIGWNVGGGSRKHAVAAVMTNDEEAKKASMRVAHSFLEEPGITIFAG
ncbi:hypothetical protein VTK56DRAFT_1543 [Thermocarpiscus australiensis]